MSSFSYLTGCFFCFLVLIIISFVNSEEECLRKRIRCYECSTATKPECQDPFNPDSLNDLASETNVNKSDCLGCCVKIIRKRNTPQQIITRTCTQNLQINFFMVDHVCMEESDGKGIMCFCESELCNRSSTITYPLSGVLFSSIIVPLISELASSKLRS